MKIFACDGELYEKGGGAFFWLWCFSKNPKDIDGKGVAMCDPKAWGV